MYRVIQPKHLTQLLRGLAFKLSTTGRGYKLPFVDICPSMLSEDNGSQLLKDFPNFDRSEFIRQLELFKAMLDVYSETNTESLSSDLLKVWIYKRFSGHENVNPNPELDIDCSHEWLDYFLSWAEFDVNSYEKYSDSLMSYAFYAKNQEAVKVLLRHGHKLRPNSTQYFPRKISNLRHMINDNELGPVSPLEAQKAIETLLVIKNILERHESEQKACAARNSPACSAKFEVTVPPVLKPSMQPDMKAGELCPVSGKWEAILPADHPKIGMLSKTPQRFIDRKQGELLPRFGFEESVEQQLRWRLVSSSDYS